MHGEEVIRYWILYADYANILICKVSMFMKRKPSSVSLMTPVRDLDQNISFSKTKTQVFSCKQLVENKTLTLTSVGVCQLVYLGHLITNLELGCYTNEHKELLENLLN